MSDYDENKLITAMVGREVSSLYPDEARDTRPGPAQRARPTPDPGQSGRGSRRESR